MLHARIALFLQTVRAQGDEAKQRVVVAAADPRGVGERRADSALSSPAVTAVTARREVFLVTLLGDAS